MGSHIVFSSETRLADARELTIAKGLTLEEWPSNDGPIFTQVENYFYLQSVGPGIEVCEKNDVAFYAIFLVTKVTKMTKVEVSASHYLGLLECHTQGIHLISQSPGPASTLRASRRARSELSCSLDQAVYCTLQTEQEIIQNKDSTKHSKAIPKPWATQNEKNHRFAASHINYSVLCYVCSLEKPKLPTLIFVAVECGLQWQKTQRI